MQYEAALKKTSEVQKNLGCLLETRFRSPCSSTSILYLLDLAMLKISDVRFYNMTSLDCKRGILIHGQRLFLQDKSRLILTPNNGAAAAAAVLMNKGEA